MFFAIITKNLNWTNGLDGNIDFAEIVVEREWSIIKQITNILIWVSLFHTFSFYGGSLKNQILRGKTQYIGGTAWKWGGGGGLGQFSVLKGKLAKKEEAGCFWRGGTQMHTISCPYVKTILSWIVNKLELTISL